LRVLVSTFGRGDLDKTLLAMRSLPYEVLVLIGEPGADQSEDFKHIAGLESMSGHQLLYEELDDDDFGEVVDHICQIVARHGYHNGTRSDVSINIGGGPKLMGNAALLCAFRMGVPAYHIDKDCLRLPVMSGVTAVARFTPLQVRFITSLREPGSISDIAARMGNLSKQSVERLMRETRKAGIVEAALESGSVRVSLTKEGAEVAKALNASAGPADP
jgi:DNA-binding transcriptional ArsR family regulator